jgi:hypothetical protein
MAQKEAAQAFADPEFLQAVGRMTIAFALLDGGLTADLAIVLTGQLSRIAASDYSQKVEEYVEVFERELNERGCTKFDRKWFCKFKNDLMGVAAQRNSFNHDFWTIDGATNRIAIKGLRGKGVPDSFPTAAKILKLSDRIYSVRERSVGPVNEYMELVIAERRSRSDEAVD